MHFSRELGIVAFFSFASILPSCVSTKKQEATSKAAGPIKKKVFGSPLTPWEGCPEFQHDRNESIPLLEQVEEVEVYCMGQHSNQELIPLGKIGKLSVGHGSFTVHNNAPSLRYQPYIGMMSACTRQAIAASSQRVAIPTDTLRLQGKIVGAQAAELPLPQEVRCEVASFALEEELAQEMAASPAKAVKQGRRDISGSDNSIFLGRQALEPPTDGRWNEDTLVEKIQRILSDHYGSNPVEEGQPDPTALANKLIYSRSQGFLVPVYVKLQDLLAKLAPELHLTPSINSINNSYRFELDRDRIILISNYFFSTSYLDEVSGEKHPLAFLHFSVSRVATFTLRAQKFSSDKIEILY
jgi:hypothetical protein